MTDVKPATDAEIELVRRWAAPTSALSAILARLDAATARIAEVEAERDEWVKTAEAFEAKWQAICTAPRNGEGTCACSYDGPDEVCFYHSPKLVAATAQAAKWERAAHAAQAAKVDERARAETAERKLAAAHEALVGCFDMLTDLRDESGRDIPYGHEDSFRMGEWFGESELATIEKARAAVALIDKTGGEG
jgi:hypothetical protein